MAKQKYDSQISLSFHCTNQPWVAMASRLPGSGCVHRSLEERLSSCYCPRKALLYLQGCCLAFKDLGPPTSAQNPLRLRSGCSGRFPLLGGVVMSLGPARSSSQCLRQEVRPSGFTMRTSSVTADRDWSSQISGAVTCLRPLAATRFALDKGAGVSWEFHPHTQKAESEYFTLSLKKMVARPSPSL